MRASEGASVFSCPVGWLIVYSAVGSSVSGICRGFSEEKCLLGAHFDVGPGSDLIDISPAASRHGKREPPHPSRMAAAISALLFHPSSRSEHHKAGCRSHVEPHHGIGLRRPACCVSIQAVVFKRGCLLYPQAPRFNTTSSQNAGTNNRGYGLLLGREALRAGRRAAWHGHRLTERSCAIHPGCPIAGLYGEYWKPVVTRWKHGMRPHAGRPNTYPGVKRWTSMSS